jgi:hypothetical protein
METTQVLSKAMSERDLPTGYSDGMRSFGYTSRAGLLITC